MLPAFVLKLNGFNYFIPLNIPVKMKINLINGLYFIDHYIFYNFMAGARCSQIFWSGGCSRQIGQSSLPHIILIKINGMPATVAGYIQKGHP